MNRLLVILGLCTAQALAVRIIGIEYMLFGGDYDENGCKPSAGYAWCNETNNCIPMNQLCTPVILDTFLDLNLSATPVP